jgi:hypothetical protein
MANETTTKEETKGGKGKNNAPPPTAAADTAAMTPPPETQAMEVFDYGDDAGQGFENQDMSDRKLPIIELLQSNSPEVVESKGKIYAGQFKNSVTGEIYDEVYFVPAITDHCWTQWVPRDDGGGFRGRHPKNAKVVLDAIERNGGRAIGKLPVPQPPDPKTQRPQPTQELVEGFEIYGILYDAKTNETLGFAMIPFTSTKIKVYRAWNSAIGNFAPTINGKKLRPGSIPLFAHRVKMTSEAETKNGNTYKVPVLSPAQERRALRRSQEAPRRCARGAREGRLRDVQAGPGRRSGEWRPVLIEGASRKVAPLN